MSNTFHNNGGFNNLLLTDDGRVVRTQRRPEFQAETMAMIDQEYSLIGISDVGVSYRLRTIEEQVAFAAQLGEMLVSAIKPEVIDDRTLTYPYITGTTVDRKLARANYECLPGVFINMLAAHSNGIAIGDRWTKNTVITPENMPVEIDFDLELTGPLTARRTIDLGQTIYHALHFAESPEVVLDVAAEYLNNPQSLQLYDYSILFGLIKSQADYFASMDLYEGVDAKKTWEVVDTMVPDSLKRNAA